MANRARPWSKRLRRPAYQTWFGTIIAEHPPSRWPNSSLKKASLAAFSIIAPSSFRIGPFQKTSRRAAPRLAFDSCERRRPSLHEELVGAGAPNWLRTYFRSSGGRFSDCSGERGPGAARFSRRARDAIRLRCRPQIGQDGTVGKSVEAQ